MLTLLLSVCVAMAAQTTAKEVIALLKDAMYIMDDSNPGPLSYTMNIKAMGFSMDAHVYKAGGKEFAEALDGKQYVDFSTGITHTVNDKEKTITISKRQTSDKKKEYTINDDGSFSDEKYCYTFKNEKNGTVSVTGKKLPTCKDKSTPDKISASILTATRQFEHIRMSLGLINTTIKITGVKHTCDPSIVTLNLADYSDYTIVDKR